MKNTYEFYDLINELTLESLKDNQLNSIITYLHKDLYSILWYYYPSLEWKKLVVFNLHPLYEKYIEWILNNNNYINQIIHSIKDYFTKNSQQISNELIFNIHSRWISFSIPINSVCWIHYYNWKYIVHNWDSKAIIDFFEKVFMIYIKNIYSIIYQIIKGENQNIETISDRRILSNIIRFK